MDSNTEPSTPLLTEPPDLPPATMFSAVHVSELLTKNVDPKLYPRMFVMSPNGTLLAYSTPVDIKELRDQAALISMAWKDPAVVAASHPDLPETKLNTNSNSSNSMSNGDRPHSSSSSQKDRRKQLTTLTVEADNANIITRALQPNLLLVLIGNVPPGRKKWKMMAEVEGDPRYPSEDLPATSRPHSQSPEAETETETGAEHDPRPHPSQDRGRDFASLTPQERDIKLGVLHIQRKKLDSLAKYMQDDFEEAGFVMPDDTGFA